MSQNDSNNRNNNRNNNNGAVGRRLFSRQTQQERQLGLATALSLEGPFTVVHVNRRPAAVSRTEDIASSRASGPTVGAAAEAARDTLVQSREVPLNIDTNVTEAPNELTKFGGYPSTLFGILPFDRDLPPASNVRENRLSAPVQSAEQETQENRRESASGQQDASTGAHSCSEQIPSQYQLKRRQRREKRGRREQLGQLRPWGAQQQGRRDFASRDYRKAMVEDAEAYVRNVRNAYENCIEADRLLEQAFRGNRGRGNGGRGNGGRGNGGRGNRGMGAYQA